MPFWRNKQASTPHLPASDDLSATAFIAIDFETANSDPASICQIGIAIYTNSGIDKSYSYLVNPECEFDDYNLAIHNIDESDVEDAPLFPEILSAISNLLTSCPVVSHTMFDRNALKRACKRYEVDFPTIDWVDSSMIARRAWSDISERGYGLENICDRIGFDYDAHDAEQDAIACGAVVMAALEHKGWSFDHAVKQSRNRKTPAKWAGKAVKREGNPAGDFFGKIIVFTGDMPVPRAEAANRAAELGFAVKNNVSKQTDILVVGKNGEGTSKHKRALELIEQGCSIEIVTAEQILSS